MNQKEVLVLAGETLTSKSQEVEVAFPTKTKSYQICPILVGNHYRVSAIANKLPTDIYVDGSFDNYKAWQAISDHTDNLLMATAICIQNREKEPSKSYLKRLKNMIFSEATMLSVFIKSLDMKGVSEFYEIYRLDKRPKCTECAGTDSDCETCKGTGLKLDEPKTDQGVDSPWSLIGSYRKYFKCSREEVLWGMSWVNLTMDLASIPSSEPTTDSKGKADEEIHIAPEDEMAQLKKDLGL